MNEKAGSHAKQYEVKQPCGKKEKVQREKQQEGKAQEGKSEDEWPDKSGFYNEDKTNKKVKRWDI